MTVPTWSIGSAIQESEIQSMHITLMQFIKPDKKSVVLPIQPDQLHAFVANCLLPIFP